MNENLVLFNLLTIQNIDTDYISSRLNSAKEHLMNYDKNIKNDDETFPFIELMTNQVPKKMLYKKKNVVEVGLKRISEARVALSEILEQHQ
jgi:hypothetical protein